MKRTLLFFGLLIAAISVGTASAQEKPAGPSKPKADDTKKAESAAVAKWDVVVSAPGQDYNGTLKIEKATEGYKGSLTTEFGEAPFTNLKLDADGFSASISVAAMGQSFDGTISGKVKDGKIGGELNLSGLGSVPFTGKKP